LGRDGPGPCLPGLRARCVCDSGAPHPALTLSMCRLNYRLSISCHDTIVDKCADACTSTSIEQPCGGTVLRCLTEKLEDITDAECKKEVFYFVKMEARAPRQAQPGGGPLRVRAGLASCA